MQWMKRFGLQRKHITHHTIEFLRKHTTQTNPFHLIIEFGVKRVDVDGQATFAPQVIPNILKTGRNVIRTKAQFAT